MKENDTLELLIEKLKWLRLPGMAEALQPVLTTAAKENLATLDVIDRLVDEETRSRLRRSPCGPWPRHVSNGAVPRARSCPLAGVQPGRTSQRMPAGDEQSKPAEPVEDACTPG